MKPVDQAIVELAARQHWTFSRRQAIALGVPPGTCDRRLQAGRWCDGGYAGVYLLPGHPKSWHQRLMAATLSGPTGTVASHRSAAVLHGIREATAIELTVPPGANHRIKVIVHRSELVRADRAMVVGIPITAIDRTLVDLGAILNDAPLEQALEAAWRLGLTTPERVRGRLDELAAPGRGGVTRLRRVLDRRAAGRAAGSELEVRVIQLLRAAGLPDPVRQFEVVIGGTRYFIDLAYLARRLAIELDGIDGHTGAHFQTDRTRQNALVLAGWAVLRFTWGDAMDRPHDLVSAVALATAA